MRAVLARFDAHHWERSEKDEMNVLLAGLVEKIGQLQTASARRTRASRAACGSSLTSVACSLASLPTR